MREVKSWIYLGVGLLLASLTGVVTYGLTQQVAPGQAAGASASIEVLVAKVDLPIRTVVTADALMRKSYAIDLVPEGAVVREADAIGLTTVAPIVRGQMLVTGQLAAVGGKKGASVTLQKGLVLVSFPTTDPLTIGGLVNVGDRVDILASASVGIGDSVRMSQTTLQNLEVIDIVAPTQEQPQRATALVFAVDHQVALVLKFLRDSQASIDLAIRSRAENEAVKTIGVDQTFLNQTYGFRR